jgi:hypothetical protein
VDLLEVDVSDAIPSHFVKLADRYGPVLAGRGLAEHLRSEIETEVSTGHHVLVDLRAVQAVSPSFADELFGKLVAQVGDGVEFTNLTPNLAVIAEINRSQANGRLLTSLSRPRLADRRTRRPRPISRDGATPSRSRGHPMPICSSSRIPAKDRADLLAAHRAAASIVASPLRLA